MTDAAPEARAAWLARNLLGAAAVVLESPDRPAEVVLAYQAVAAAGFLAGAIPGGEGDALRAGAEASRLRALDAAAALGLDVLDLVAAGGPGIPQG